MKAKFLKFIIPIGMGLSLFTITIFGIVSTAFVGCEKDAATTVCKSGSCLGTDGLCYGACSSGFSCTTTPSGNCSAASPGGVYCCGGGGSSGSW